MESNQSQPVEKRQEEKVGKPGLFSRIKNKLVEYKRVVSVAQKPSKEEFLLSTKITGSGIAFIGMIGFIIFLLYFLVVR
jgi:protein transport protein SEC61 subunit gamma-like protein